MSADPVRTESATGPWPSRRLRAEELRDRQPFAAEPLTLYLALLDVQEDVWSAVAASPPPPEELSAWAAAQVLPGVVEATVAAGPPALRRAVVSRTAEGAAAGALTGWLAGMELDPVDRYLARASLAPALEALGGRAGTACAADRRGASGALCPCCGGRPQLAVLAATGDALVSGKRSLLCARCGSSWLVTRSACAACGETDDGRLVTFAEHWEGVVSVNGNGDTGAGPVFPQLRVAGCTTCGRYLIEVDLARDGSAVPEVDELAALPLDLYAAERGLTKVTPNLMGF
jgi:hypothetical protein